MTRHCCQGKALGEDHDFACPTQTVGQLFSNKRPIIPPAKKHPARDRAFLIAGCVLAGIGIGMNIWGPPKTIVKHETGPTVTVYSKQPEPPAKVIQVQLPQSCKDALDLAAKVSANAVTMADSSLPLIDAMQQAYVASVNGTKASQNDAVSKMVQINSTTLESKTNYVILYPQYTAKWQQCQKEIK